MTGMNKCTGVSVSKQNKTKTPSSQDVWILTIDNQCYLSSSHTQDTHMMSMNMCTHNSLLEKLGQEHSVLSHCCSATRPLNKLLGDQKKEVYNTSKLLKNVKMGISMVIKISVFKNVT